MLSPWPYYLNVSLNLWQCLFQINSKERNWPRKKTSDSYIINSKLIEWIKIRIELEGVCNNDKEFWIYNLRELFKSQPIDQL